MVQVLNMGDLGLQRKLRVFLIQHGIYDANIQPSIVIEQKQVKYFFTQHGIATRTVNSVLKGLPNCINVAHLSCACDALGMDMPMDILGVIFDDVANLKQPTVSPVAGPLVIVDSDSEENQIVEHVPRHSRYATMTVEELRLVVQFRDDRVAMLEKKPKDGRQQLRL